LRLTASVQVSYFLTAEPLENIGEPFQVSYESAQALSLRPTQKHPYGCFFLCRRRDLNSHGLPRAILSRVRLPFRHFGIRAIIARMRKRSTIIAIILIIIIAGLVTWMSKSTMSHDVLSGIEDADGGVKVFLEMMIPHHQEAVETSLKVMQDPNIDNPKLRILAGRIYDAQTFEIIQMKTWYAEWFGVPYTASSTLLAHPYMPMMGDLSALTGKDLEKAYINGMIEHHKMAIDTAEDVKTFLEKAQEKGGISDGDLTIINSHPGVDQTLIFTQKIIDVQSKEIQQLKDLR
jgi:uncharacterized protein (DUF305 family)